MRNPKVYLASPFFNPEQVAFVDKLEALIEKAGYEMFSPRKGENALEMNALLKQKFGRKKVLDELISRGVVTAVAYEELAQFEPPGDLRLRVFNDNWSNIDDADLVVANIDDFDVGVMWEVGYAYARQVPIITTTNKMYGCNLMLAYSIIGHTKSLEALEEALRLGHPNLSLESSMETYGKVIAQIQHRFKSDLMLKEGPDERRQ